MKQRMKKWLRPALFFLGGALLGLGLYYFVGCPTGSCTILSNPLASMGYTGLLGFLMSGSLCSCRSGSCRR